jgi:MFS family permease
MTDNPRSARSTHSDILLLYAARGTRGFGDGFAIIILPAYLSVIGFSPGQIGFVASASLLGTALFTLAIGFFAPRHDLRNLLLGGAVLMVCTGVAFPNFDQFAFIALVAFVGTVNPSTGDLGVLVPLEHAMLAQGVPDHERTHTFARYSLIGTLSMAAGALAAAVPDYLVLANISSADAFKAIFNAYAALGLLSAALYRRLPHVRMDEARPSAPLGPSRGVVYKLAALFSLDAFAGGFVVQSLLALWLFERFDMSLSAASLFFFWSSTLSAFSYPVAAWLAKRIGLINTMVYTHIPLQHLSHSGGVLAEFDPGARPAVGAFGAFTNGRTHAHVLCDGRRDAGRAHGGRQRHRRSAQSRLVDKPGHDRCAAGDAVCRAAADRVRCS